MNSYGDGNTYRGTTCKDSETPTVYTNGPCIANNCNGKHALSLEAGPFRECGDYRKEDCPHLRVISKGGREVFLCLYEWEVSYCGSE